MIKVKELIMGTVLYTIDFNSDFTIFFFSLMSFFYCRIQSRLPHCIWLSYLLSLFLSVTIPLTFHYDFDIVNEYYSGYFTEGPSI